MSELSVKDDRYQDTSSPYWQAEHYRYRMGDYLRSPI